MCVCVCVRAKNGMVKCIVRGLVLPVFLVGYLSCVDIESSNVRTVSSL